MNYRFKRLKERIEHFLVENIALPIIRRSERNSRYISHFKKEMEFLHGGKKSCGIDALMEEQVCDLLALLSTQGDSGFSIGFKKHYLTKAMMFEVLSPLTFNDDEFGNDYGGDSVQNVRDSSVFKDKATGRIYDIDSFSHRILFTYNIDTRELEKGSETTWSGGIMVYDDVNGKGWFGVSSGSINPENKHFVGENQVIVPVVQLVDDKCDRGTFIMNITKLSCFPKKFFKDYKLIPSDKKWAKEDCDLIQSNYRREIMFIDAMKDLPAGE